MDSSEPTVVARGTIHGHEARGEAVLVQTPEGAVLHLRNHWIAPGAPDVRIYLSPDPGGDTETDGAVDSGKATAFSGDASYVVPDRVDVSIMRSAVVYCKVYSVLFGAAPLE